MEGEALATLVVNSLRGILRCVAVKAPAFGDRRKEILRDIAIVTGGEYISEDLGSKLESVELAQLGSAKRIEIDKDTTTTKHQVGDPTYLNVILACSTQRRALLGLDAPSKAHEFIAQELRAGLERLRDNLSPALFQQVAGLLAGDHSGLVSAA